MITPTKANHRGGSGRRAGDKDSASSREAGVEQHASPLLLPDGLSPLSPPHYEQMEQGLAELRHESRNAFQRIQANLELLELDLAGRSELLSYVQSIDSAQSQLHHMFEDYCTFHGPMPVLGRPTDLMTTWRNAWEQLSGLRVGRVAELDEERFLQEPKCSGDGVGLQQVFHHLFENCLAAVDDPVLISISTRPAQLGTHPAIEVSVRDNGPGISPELRTRIFEPYFTTNRRATGLGLPICQQIVTAHQGRLILSSSPARGAEFLLTLPLGGY